MCCQFVVFPSDSYLGANHTQWYWTLTSMKKTLVHYYCSVILLTISILFPLMVYRYAVNSSELQLNRAASWRKRLGSRLPPLGSRVRVSVTPCGWAKQGLGRFFSGFLPFSPTTNFIPPFLHSHLIHLVSFHQPLWWCVRRGRPAPLLLTDL